MSKIANIQNVDLNFLLVFLWRRKWIIIFVFVIVFALTQIHILRSPKVYQARVVLSIVPQKVPSSYVRSTVSGDMEAFMHSIWQEITSRTNLERLIKEYNLYPGMVKAVPMETVVERMRRAIKVSRPRGGRRNVFVISFRYYDPQLAAKVVNNIANTFIEENLKLREEQAKTVTAFLDEELERIEKELREREMAIQEYKQRYMAELPEQKDSIIAILSRLQKESETLQMRKEMLQDRKVAILDYLNKLKSEREEADLIEENAGIDSMMGTLDQLERRYLSLRMKYTEKHPDVIRLKKLIEAKKKELQGFSDNSSNGLQGKANNPIYQLQLQLKNIDKEISRIDELHQKVLEKIKLYQKRLENIPKREQELKDLTRDYANLMKTYRMLLDKKIQAAMAETLEKRQQGEQFRIIDRARVPEVPVSPDVKKILTMGLVLALGLGVGLAFLMEFFLDKRVYDPSMLEAATELKVLATIPMVILPVQKRRIYLKNFSLAFLALVGISINLFLFWKIYNNLQV
jgi:polysaccharide chain length determinant protein (PEP-CTERM system associated)